MLRLKSIAQIATPPYLFRPNQIVNRLWRELAWRNSRRRVVNLPWGLDIALDPHEAVGYNIWTRGIYELAVTEALWQLTEPGELAIDVGSNIGYTASILATRAGKMGRVLCFEPHPEVFASLKENVVRWQKHKNCGTLVLHAVALGRRDGVALLRTDDWFNSNKGTAHLTAVPDSNPGSKTIPVKLRCLDRIMGDGQHAGVVKIDAQGSELDIFHGMTKLLEQRRVRNIVFEEQAAFPAPTHEFLESAGYTVFGLEPRLYGLRCLLRAAPSTPPDGDPLTYLASCEPGRALQKLNRFGWHSFGVFRST